MLHCDITSLDLSGIEKFESFDKKLEYVRRKAESVMPFVHSEIERIIMTNDRKIEDIEYLLETLLEYCALGVGREEFLRLNRYYAMLDKKNAEAYLRSYEIIVISAKHY
ncbi:MAG: hypothetical protein QXJ50_00275 [Candidatus Woesearchaeota archaeon]